jgi:hypothetical protein
VDSIQQIVKRSLSGFPLGGVIFPSDFRGHGSQDAIKMALSRLVKQGHLKRLAHGIYYRPFIDPKLGELIPSPEAVAENLAEREQVRIRPAGSYALHKLGLSTQVPTKLVYLTDGHPRKLKVGKATIEFKATTPKKMALKGSISGLLILALEELDIDHINETTEKRIMGLLAREDYSNLIHDLRLAPGKIYNYLEKLLKRLEESSIFSTLKQTK